MNNEIELTVGIPTYNGASYIKEAIDSVLAQIDAQTVASIEVLVLDNASTDQTAEIVRGYESQPGSLVRSVRNSVNVGFDRNIDRIFKNARGKYVWLLADDDVFESGALLYVLGVLRRHRVIGSVLVNFDQYDRELKHLVDQVELGKELLCTDAETFLRYSNSRYNLVSSLIIDRNLWNSLDLADGFGTNFIHVYALMEMILKADSYIIPRSLIRMRMGSTSTGTSGDSRLSIALDAGAIIKSMRKMGHEVRVVRGLLKDARRYTFDMIPAAKMAGLKDVLGLTKRLISVYNCPQLWLKWIPIIFMPNSVFAKLYPLKKTLSARTKFIERGLKKLLKR